MEASYQVLKQAIDKIGVKMLAAELSLSPSLIYKWCEQNSEDDNQSSGATNPLDRIFRIVQATQDESLINWLCQMANGYFVHNPEIEKKITKKIDVAQRIHGLIKEFSKTLDTISNSYYDDERISNDEANLIRKEWEDLKQVGESFVRACELGTYSKKDKK